MSSEKLFLPILLGTPRKARESEQVAKWVLSRMQERQEIETQLFDVSDFDLPHDYYGTEIGDQFPEWRDAIIRADGLVIVTPEYNHAYPGALKSVLDLLLKEYIHKAVAFVGVSAGPWGGTRVIEACVPMVRARPRGYLRRSKFSVSRKQIRRQRQPARPRLQRSRQRLPRRSGLDGVHTPLGPK